MSNQPIKRFRLGFLSCTIWENEKTEGNGKWYSIDLSRSYKNGDGELAHTTSLNAADLLNAARLLTRAEAWIAEQ